MGMTIMKSAAAKPQKSFNPEAFRSDMMRLPAADAADVTLKWRERAMNAAEAFDQATDTGLKLLSGGTFVFLVGMFEGRQKANAEQLILDWEAGGAEEAAADLEESPTPWSAGVGRDPSKLLGFLPWTLALTALPAVIGIFDTKASPYFRSMATAGAYFFVGNLGSMAGHRIRTKRLAAAATEETEAAA